MGKLSVLANHSTKDVEILAESETWGKSKMLLSRNEALELSDVLLKSAFSLMNETEIVEYMRKRFNR